MHETAEFDVIVYGATGYTGKLVAEYLNETYGQRLRWAMAGRSADKLAQVRDELGASAELPLIVADSAEPASLAAMAARTHCVISTVGPYARYGSALVAACVAAGTDHVDLSGEPLWMREMIESHAEAAKASGARIVHSCGFDSIPFDLGVQYLQEVAAEELGGPCPRVRCRVRQMQGTMSGGTVASSVATMEAVAKEPELLETLLNPFALCNGFTGPEQPSGQEVMHDEHLDSWVAPFVMAVINTKNIHRSNKLLQHAYGRDFVYDEMMLAGPGEEGQQTAKVMAGMMDMAAGDSVPQPGEGPSKEERDAGFYDLLFVGTSEQGEVRVSVQGDKDPGYGSTSKMMAEAGLCLIHDRTELAGGVWTPAAALGATLRKRLIDHAGLSFTRETSD